VAGEKASTIVKTDPDPSQRTVEQSLLGYANLKELIETHIDGLKGEIDEIRALVKALPGVIDEKVLSLRSVIDEKLVGVNTQFTMRDIALAAAFKAAQDQAKITNDGNTLAIDKASAGTTKQIDGLNEKIDDLKERISELGRRDWATVGAYIVGAIGIAALIAAALLKH
jgi:hypothetical protein